MKFQSGFNKLTVTVSICRIMDFFGEPGGTRTLDHSIKSRMLYQLSYRLTASHRVKVTADPVNRHHCKN